MVLISYTSTSRVMSLFACLGHSQNRQCLLRRKPFIFSTSFGGSEIPPKISSLNLPHPLPHPRWRWRTVQRPRLSFLSRRGQSLGCTLEPNNWVVYTKPFLRFHFVDFCLEKQKLMIQIVAL